VATSRDGDLAWLKSLPHVTVTRPGRDYIEARVDAGVDPQAMLRAAIAHGGDILRFEVADPSLEDVFIERVGVLNGKKRTLAQIPEVRS
jgi:ABC-2 type transport system ATP-binding protein